MLRKTRAQVRNLAAIVISACFLVLTVRAGAPVIAQDAAAAADSRWEEFRSALGFEAGTPGSAPPGWGGTQDAAFVDAEVHHGGTRAGRLEGVGALTNIRKSIPINFAGETIELRGFLRTQDVTGFAGLWLREDGDQTVLALDNMSTRRLTGSTGWTQYTVRLPYIPDARRLIFGAYLTGSGRIWADDLELLVDGKPVWEAPLARHREEHAAD